MRPGILVILICFMSFALAHAQSSRKERKNKEKNSARTSQPTSVDPSYPTMDYAPKYDKKVQSIELSYNAERRYYQQKEKIAKARKKAEKELMKPQYSDPMYFGHKRPPKKHKPGKMKFCKVCGIRH